MTGKSADIAESMGNIDNVYVLWMGIERPKPSAGIRYYPPIPDRQTAIFLISYL
jgi:hypothetical protein